MPDTVPTKHAGVDSLMLSTVDAAALLGVTVQAVRDGCSAGRYAGAVKDEAGAWRIPFSSLPVEARARHLVQYAGIAPGATPTADRRELPPEEAEILWRRFEDAGKKAKERAWRDVEACYFWRLSLAEGKGRKEIVAEIAERFGIGQSALYDKLGRVSGYDPMHWPALLAGQWTGEGARSAEWPPEAWKHFLRHALSPRCPIKTAWNRTRREAARQKWGPIPSYTTAKRQFDELPHDAVTFIKEGETALKALSPTARRDYDLPLHDTWSMDGRRLDLMCIDRKGKYGPPGNVFRLWVYAYAEVRSRYLLGYALGGRLNSDLVRAGFLAAIKTTGRIVPREIEPDSGTEIAAKENTGGASWRRRFKVKDDDIIGLFPRLGIEVGWATIAHGQAKIIERLFGTLARMVETRPEFRGAYCGHTPEARPEEWDRAKAVDVELIETIFAQEVDAYNCEPHRGQGMDGKSPVLVYTEQANVPGLALRTITAAQERICTYSAVPITISSKDGSFTILGARYWSEGSAKLAPGKGYYALYNPGNLSDEAYVYRAKKLLCTAQKIELTSYNDKTTGKEIMRKRAAYTRSVKQVAAALEDLASAEGEGLAAQLPKLRAGEAMDMQTGETREKLPLPKSAVRQLVPTQTDLLPAPAATPTKEEDALRRRVEELERQEEQKAIDGLRKRAAGRR